jgi:hypothetical protein
MAIVAPLHAPVPPQKDKQTVRKLSFSYGYLYRWVEVLFIAGSPELKFPRTQVHQNANSSAVFPDDSQNSVVS